MKKLTSFVLLAGLLAVPAFGNNLNITNVALRSINRKMAAIELDLSWENAWHDDVNHDAAWLFVKYSVDEGTTWNHATLKETGTSTGCNTDIEIVVPSDGKGAFVNRLSQGQGHLATEGLELIWDLEADGVPADATGRISVHGLEMVYIPEGAFYVGDGESNRSFPVTYINTPTMTNTAASGAGTIASPWVNLTAGMGRPYGVKGAFTNDYPNGYNAFYIMKYELSRARYLEFLNQITETQAATLRSATAADFANPEASPPSSHKITGSHPNLTNSEPWRAAELHLGSPPSCSGWQEYFAYTDWAGLRPFTEMEYEKACRGPLLPRARDYPWGLPSRHIANWFKDIRTPSESPTMPDANLLAAGTYLSIFPHAPIRNGAMSTPTSDQFQAGASYYGVMDLAGNVGERCIATVDFEDARNFNGRHGDGVLNEDGTANVPGWPYMTESHYRYRGPVGVRGGDYGAASLECTISDRTESQHNYYKPVGIRSVRTAP